MPDNPEKQESGGFQNNSEVQASIMEAETTCQAVFEATFPFLEVEQMFDVKIDDDNSLGGMVVCDDQNFYQFWMDSETKIMGMHRWLEPEQVIDPNSPPLVQVTSIYPKLVAQNVRMESDTVGVVTNKDGAAYALNVDPQNQIYSLFPAQIKESEVNPNGAGDRGKDTSSQKPKAKNQASADPQRQQKPDNPGPSV